ncbi:MAG: hypothetical protein LAT67_11320 [Balneolales bacterium]|nr:hypothetical protein [Balneolales bacterium]
MYTPKSASALFCLAVLLTAISLLNAQNTNSQELQEVPEFLELVEVFTLTNDTYINDINQIRTDKNGNFVLIDLYSNQLFFVPASGDDRGEATAFTPESCPELADYYSPYDAQIISENEVIIHNLHDASYIADLDGNCIEILQVPGRGQVNRAVSAAGIVSHLSSNEGEHILVITPRKTGTDFRYDTVNYEQVEETNIAHTLSGIQLPVTGHNVVGGGLFALPGDRGFQLVTSSTARVYSYNLDGDLQGDAAPTFSFYSENTRDLQASLESDRRISQLIPMLQAYGHTGRTWQINESTLLISYQLPQELQDEEYPVTVLMEYDLVEKMYTGRHFRFPLSFEIAGIQNDRIYTAQRTEQAALQGIINPQIFIYRLN